VAVCGEKTAGVDVGDKGENVVGWDREEWVFES
jgi:hypothetical protein